MPPLFLLLSIFFPPSSSAQSLAPLAAVGDGRAEDPGGSSVPREVSSLGEDRLEAVAEKEDEGRLVAPLTADTAAGGRAEKGLIGLGGVGGEEVDGV